MSAEGRIPPKTDPIAASPRPLVASDPPPPKRRSRIGCAVVALIIACVALSVSYGQWGTGDHNNPTATAPAPFPTPTPRKKPIEILDTSSKDAGLGDGTIYVYVDIVNNTDHLYEYVEIDGTCRNKNGQVGATGIGNPANLAAGEKTTITVLMLNAEGCDTIHVETSPLSG